MGVPKRVRRFYDGTDLLVIFDLYPPDDLVDNRLPVAYLILANFANNHALRLP